MADPNITFVSMHRMYKKCVGRQKQRILAYESFRKVVKCLMPTFHLGKTRKDSCKACFSLDLQIKDPESEELKQELFAVTETHHEDSINTRKRY